jgi:hypothetical protein
MNILAREELRSLMDVQKGPCASIYISLPPSGEPSSQARIKLKNAVRELEDLFEKNDIGKKERSSLREPLEELIRNISFWKDLKTGLAIFVSGDDIRYFRLPVEVKDLVNLSERFYIKPLINLFSGEEQYYLLAFSQKRVRLFRGSRYSLDLLESENMPDGLKEALNYEEREKVLHRTHGGGGGMTPVHGAGYELLKDDLVKYFRIIDKAVLDRLEDRKRPLLLAAVEAEISLYRKVCSYPGVLQKGLAGNPDSLSGHELHRRSMEIMDPYFKEQEEKAISEYNEMVGLNRTSHDLRDILPFASEGRIKTFFVARDHRQWGKFDPSAHLLDVHNERAKGDQDLLDLTAYHTILNGGTVFVIDNEKVPGGGLASAIFRY